jgi:amino acid adenylation domain-containing protein
VDRGPAVHGRQRGGTRSNLPVDSARTNAPHEETGPPSFPLSFAQQRLWFLYQLDPRSSLYNLPLRLRLRGPLDVAALKAALERLLERHESLRTRFQQRDGDVYQMICPAEPLVLELEDIGRSAEIERAAGDLATAEANRPFKLDGGELFRLRLVRLGDHDHLLLLTVHHVVADGWSLNILLRELGELYAAEIEGRPAHLPPLPIQYVDYAVWQHELMSGERLERELDFWHDSLEGAPPVLELPTDRPRLSVRTDRGAHVRRALSPELAARLREVAAAEGATLFMTILAAFAALLGKYAGEETVVIGTPVANRPRRELESVIGFFANMLALRVDLTGDPTFRELLHQVRERCLEAYAHQELPFERLVEDLNPSRDLGRSPVFQVVFALQNYEQGVPDLPEIEVTSLPLDRERSKFDLALFAAERNGGLLLSFEFAADLFDASTVERMLGHLETLLQAAVSEPQRPLSKLPLLTDAQRYELLFGWNQTERPFPADRCVHELFEDEVEHRPDAIALSVDDQTISYRELNERANVLAHRLRGLGVGPEVLVGICLERSIDLIVSILATLKAGGAYVPLDPEYPRQRLAFMLEDTDAPVLISRTNLSARLPPFEGTLLHLDAAEGEPRNGFAANPKAAVRSDNLAYVMYTSGSTGGPKGVMIEHRAICRLVKGADYLDFGPDQVFLQLAPVSFDASTFEIWGALLNGARLAIFRPGPVTISSLATTLREERVTTLWLTAALFHHVAAEAPSTFTGLEYLLSGGDVLAVEHVRSAVKALEGGRFADFYGPTETTTFATWYQVTATTELDDSVPIGRPIANTEVYILDARLEPVPIGVAGELYIGGPGVARGYLNRPELTAERFVADPFSGRPGARLYRTGDRVRYRSDGTIEFHGRFDDQVKVRGFRVEPGEVEAALLAHPGVREVAVVARREANGDHRLLAYFTGAVPAPTTTALREFLAERLPDHMLPAALVPLEQLPYTPSGKVDRRALPEPADRPELEQAYVAPQTETEAALAELVAELLGLEQVGREDDFFELGGHSLLAIKLFARIERIWKVRPPLAVLFDTATVRHLASAIEAEKARDEAWSSILPLRPLGARPPLFVMHAHSGEVFWARFLVRHLPEDQPVYGIQGVGAKGRQTPRLTFEEMAASYVRDMVRVHPEGPFFLIGYCFGGVLAYEVARQLQDAGREMALLGLIDAAPFGHGSRPSRLEHERQQFGEFRRRDLRGKGEWVRRRSLRLIHGIKTHLQWTLFARLSRSRWPIPSFLWNMSAVIERAGRRYVAPTAPCRVTLFRAAEPGKRSNEGSHGLWSSLAQGGVDIRWIEGHGVRHDTIFREPHAQTLAIEIARAIEEAQAQFASGPAAASLQPTRPRLGSAAGRGRRSA